MKSQTMRFSEILCFITKDPQQYIQSPADVFSLLSTEFSTSFRRLFAQWIYFEFQNMEFP